METLLQLGASIGLKYVLLFSAELPTQPQILKSDFVSQSTLSTQIHRRQPGFRVLDPEWMRYTKLYIFLKLDWCLLYCSEQMMFFVYERN